MSAVDSLAIDNSSVVDNLSAVDSSSVDCSPVVDSLAVDYWLADDSRRWLLVILLAVDNLSPADLSSSAVDNLTAVDSLSFYCLSTVDLLAVDFLSHFIGWLLVTRCLLIRCCLLKICLFLIG